jgi:pimeloyl-ACP methyl ester carboxylesterase
VPVVIMMGRYDLITPYATAKELFDGVEAPAKTFVTFERSAHFTMFSEPGRVLEALLKHVVLLTEGLAKYPPPATTTSAGESA